MRSVVARLVRALAILKETYGLRLRPVIAIVVLVLLRLLALVTRPVDHLLFAALRRVEIERPVVLVGAPRTGSTFLHRFLCDQGIGAGLPLYRMVLGSIVLQKLLGPLMMRLERRSASANLYSRSIHQTGLDQFEADDAVLMFGYGDGPIAYSFVFAHSTDDLLPQFDPENRATFGRYATEIDRCWRRNLAVTGADRVVAKLFSLCAELPSFQERYPDARILFMVRDPVDAIPSALSLAVSVQEEAFGFSALGLAAQQRYLDRVYEALVFLLRRFHDHWISGRIRRDRVLVVRYDRLLADFEGVATEIMAFVGHRPSAATKEAIAQQDELQRTRTSNHRYTATRFGLSVEQIRRDCGFFYETFLPAESKTPRDRKAGANRVQAGP